MKRLLSHIIGATALLGALILAATASAIVETEFGQTLHALKIDDHGIARIFLSSPVASTQCSNLAIHFDATTAVGKNYLALLLTAKVTGNLLHVKFDRNGTACELIEVHMF